MLAASAGKEKSVDSGQVFVIYMMETQVRSLSHEDPLEKGMATRCSILAWRMPWTEEPGGLQSMGSLRVRHDLVTSLSLFTFMHWRRKWQPTPVFLPRESQGRGSLVGCRLWGHTGSDTTEAIQQQQQSIYTHAVRIMKIWFHIENNHLLYIIESDCGKQNNTPTPKCPYPNSWYL